MLPKFCDKNTVKISYIRMRIMGKIIKGKNDKILDCENCREKYSCRKAVNCPPNGECLVEDFVYRAKVVAIKNEEKCTLILRKESFKTLYYNHKSSFQLPR